MRCGLSLKAKAVRMSSIVVRGFTLIELLVVISIIAVLMSVLLPALGRARDQAKLVACKSILRNLAVATTIYAQENRDRMPLYGEDINTEPWEPLLADIMMMHSKEELKDKVLRCPAGKKDDGYHYGYNARVRNWKTQQIKDPRTRIAFLDAPSPIVYKPWEDETHMSFPHLGKEYCNLGYVDTHVEEWKGDPINNTADCDFLYEQFGKWELNKRD